MGQGGRQIPVAEQIVRMLRSLLFFFYFFFGNYVLRSLIGRKGIGNKFLGIVKSLGTTNFLDSRDACIQSIGKQLLVAQQ
jgi:hypothetical protein